MIVKLYNILIYTYNTNLRFIKVIQLVFKQQKKYWLYTNLKRCYFYLDEILLSYLYNMLIRYLYKKKVN